MLVFKLIIGTPGNIMYDIKNLLNLSFTHTWDPLRVRLRFYSGLRESTRLRADPKSPTLLSSVISFS